MEITVSSRRRRTRRTILLALVVLAALLVVGCGAGGSGEPGGNEKSGDAGLRPARMAVWSPPLAEQSNVYAAQEFGWFKDRGLGFELIPGEGGGDAVQQLISGNADFAFANIEALLLAVDKGAKLKAVYNIYPQNVFNVVSPKGKGITKPEDLKGKKIGVYSRTSGTYQSLLYILNSAGLSEEDVEVVPVGVANFGPLISGQVDAMAATDTGLYLAQQKGLGEANVMWARDFFNSPSDVMIVREETYEKEKDYVLDFLAAYKQGTQWMLDHPEEAAELAKEYAVNADDARANLETIRLRNEATLSPATKEYGLGWFELDLLQGQAEKYREVGLVKNPIDVDALYTNELVERLR
ncbi:MAG: ABC transporter substrate-binding protein [Actinomycetota bacterium]|nr:ABC transporter substrate-binding protein [Actinomycetota bacterium]